MSRPNTSLDPSDAHKRRVYPIERNVSYRCVRGKKVCAMGSGRSVEIGSRELTFTTQDAVELGQRVEAAVNWPVPLAGNCPIRLIVMGHVVRIVEGCVSVSIDRHEFRTRDAIPSSTTPLARSASD